MLLTFMNFLYFLIECSCVCSVFTSSESLIAHEKQLIHLFLIFTIYQADLLMFQLLIIIKIFIEFNKFIELKEFVELKKFRKKEKNE